MTENWALLAREITARPIPHDIRDRLEAMPDAVEALSDALRVLGIESSVDLGDWPANRSAILHIGPIVTMRYVPKMTANDDMRLGNAQLAPLLPPGAIVVEDARGCEGCVLGGYAAGLLQRGGAEVVIVDGLVRDPGQCDDAGLAVIASRFGIQSGRSSLQAVDIGGPIVLRNRCVMSGDVGVVNRNGLVAIPSWLTWDDVRRLSIFS